VAYAEPAGAPRRALPIALVSGGAAVLVALLPLGQKATLAGGVAFLLATVLALADSYRPVFTWPNAIAALVLVLWFVPIKLYALPVSLPFNLEPYRLLLLVLVFAWIVQIILKRGRVEAAGRGDPILLLIAVAIVSTIVNFDTLSAVADESPINPVLYFISFLLLFVLLASTVDSLQTVDWILKTLVAGAAVVALCAIYEARTRYNVFDHLSDFVPVLDKQFREIGVTSTGRAGQLRVHASAQHPIAFGVALIMMLPVAVYLAKHAATQARARVWVLCGLVCSVAAVTTVSRTTVVMLVAMFAVAIALRGAAIVRYWPVLLVLPIAVHFVAPGALGGLYKAFFPKEGLIGDVQGRAGESGSGRFADIRPGLTLFAQEPVVGHGPGAEIIAEPKETHLGTAPRAVIIFDNEYMRTLVQLGLLGLLGVIALVWGSVVRLFRAARRSTGPPADLLVACTVSCAGFGVAMFFFDAFAFVQCTLVFVFLAALGLRVARMRRLRPVPVEARPAAA
jgi:O-antigen ligase/polysaccharide polymerase Wzy-like membrane protein